MKKIVTLFLVVMLLVQWNGYGQMYSKGETFPDITLTDIKGKKYNLYEYMDKGYAIVIELALTTCNYCWQLKKAGLLNNIYDQYGPNGTKKKGKILPIFVECNVNNTQDQLYGKGEGTLGDWVDGAKYPIVDLKDNAELSQLFKAPTSFGTPSFYLICSDKKKFGTIEGIDNVGTIQKDFLANIDNCAKGAPTGIDDIALANSIKVYPSPGVQKIHVELSADDALLQDITLVNIEGRSVTTVHEINTTKTTVDVAGFPGGIYMLSVTFDNGMQVNKRIVLID